MFSKTGSAIQTVTTQGNDKVMFSSIFTSKASNEQGYWFASHGLRAAGRPSPVMGCENLGRLPVSDCRLPGPREK